MMFDECPTASQDEYLDPPPWNSTGGSQAGERLADLKFARPIPDEQGPYRPSIMGRWIGLGGAVLIYAMIGAIALITIQSVRIRQAESPALTVIHIDAPSPPVDQPQKPHQAYAGQRPKRPASTPSQATPLPPPILLLPPSTVIPAMQPQDRPVLSLGPETTAIPTASQDVPSPASDSWENQILGALNKHRRYPRSAMLRRQQGVPYIRFVMNREGGIVSATLDQSSGHADLDREALAILRRAEPLPKPPTSRPGDTIELVVPVAFFLR